MSEYTPDIKMVRMCYVHDTMQYQRLLEDGYEPNVVEINLEFDRWRAKHDAEVAKAERKRIAKKVWEEKQRVFEATVKDPTNSQLLAYQSGIWRVLDIIEGENE